MKPSAKILLAAACAILVAGVALPVSACPSCQEALATDGGNFKRGLFWSIMFMLSMPFAITSCFGIAVYRATRHRAPQGFDPMTMTPPGTAPVVDSSSGDSAMASRGTPRPDEASPSSGGPIDPTA